MLIVERTTQLSGLFVNKQSFGAWLAEQREQKKMSQPQLADAARISKQYISNLERNAGHPITGAPPKPSLSVVDAIAEALRVPVSEARLAAGYAPESHAVDDPLRERFLNFYEGLNETGRRIALKVVEIIWREETLREIGTSEVSARPDKITVPLRHGGRSKKELKRKID